MLNGDAPDTRGSPARLLMGIYGNEKDVPVLGLRHYFPITNWCNGADGGEKCRDKHPVGGTAGR